MQDNTVFYTIEDVSRMLRVSTRTVRELIEQNQIEAFRVGKQWRIRKDALDRYTSGQK